jgi:hypothetical protein
MHLNSSSKSAARNSLLSVEFASHMSNLNTHGPHFTLTSHFNAVPARNAEMHFWFNYLQGDLLGGDPELIITNHEMIFQRKQHWDGKYVDKHRYSWATERVEICLPAPGDICRHMLLYVIPPWSVWNERNNEVTRTGERDTGSVSRNAENWKV